MKWYLLTAVSVLLMTGCSEKKTEVKVQQQPVPEEQAEIHWEAPKETMFWRGPGYYNGVHIESEAQFHEWHDHDKSMKPSKQQY